MKGQRAGTWPETIAAVDFNLVPASLTTWALSRGFTSAALSTNDDNQRRRVLVSAACARVIEYYWRQGNPSAQIRVLSNVRAADASDPNGNHTLGASIDFSILINNAPIGVCQTWGSLFRLAGAGRLPAGGRGIYLNISPGGITGSEPQQAGASSSRRKPAPAGSSAGVHYDYRGTFGFRPNTPANKWVGLDTTGDGTDDYELGGVNSAETLPLLAATVPTVFQYWNNQGRLDPVLLDVSNTVPNALQMLGLQEWCS